MAKKTLVQVLSDFAYDLSFQDLPPEVVEKAEISVADGIASALSGSDLPSSKIALKVWKDMKRTGKSTVWVNGETGDSESTAWVNCLLMHSILQDDMQESTVGHMGSFVIPAVFAVAEQEGKGGKDFLTAVVAAYEVSGRIALKAGLTIVKQGFRASPIFGPFAAATAAGKLIGLSRDQLRNAIACAASFSCGLLEAVNTGSMEWRFQNGAALRNGLMAAVLAKQGLLSSTTALEGRCGFYAAFGGHELREQILESQEEITKTLGKEFEVTKNIFKPYATCGYNQTGVEVASVMAKQHNLQPKDIEQVKVFVCPENKSYPGGDFHGPFATIDQALLSKPFSISAAIKFRNLTADMYLSQLNDPELAELARKVNTEAKEGMGFLDYKIEMKLKNGKMVSGDLSLVDMKNYTLDKGRIRDKFLQRTSSLLKRDKGMKIVNAILNIQGISNVTELSKIIQNAFKH